VKYISKCSAVRCAREEKVSTIHRRARKAYLIYESQQRWCRLARCIDRGRVWAFRRRRGSGRRGQLRLCVGIVAHRTRFQPRSFFCVARGSSGRTFFEVHPRVILRKAPHSALELICTTLLGLLRRIPFLCRFPSEKCPPAIALFPIWEQSAAIAASRLGDVYCRLRKVLSIELIMNDLDMGQ
jgi:hypothetical protein